MKHFILLATIVSFSNALFAIECGPKVKEGKNTFMTMVECEKNQLGCIELKETNGEFHKVDSQSKMYFRINSAKFVTDTISVSMDANSACWFEKVTGDNAGKRLAIINKDIILTFPMIQSKIAGGQLQINAAGYDGINYELCQSLYSGCKEEKPKPEDKPKKGSFMDKMANPPDINRKDINAVYGAVMESAYWVTDQPTFKTYEDGSLKKVKSLYSVPMTVHAKKKSVPFFYGLQEFDSKTKKYVYAENAIKLESVGWVKRDDIVPYNVIDPSPESELRKSLVGGLFAKKCTGLLKVSSDEIESMYRNNMTAFCVKVGQPECEDYITKAKESLEKMECPKSFK